MSESLTIARPYARAVYERALETQQIDRWQGFLDVANCFFGQQEVTLRLGIAGFRQAVIGWIDELLKQQRGEGLNQEEQNFLALLQEFGRDKVLPEIVHLFSQLRREEQQKLLAEIKSAKELNEEQIGEISTTLAKRFGKEIETTVEVDPSLIAGLRIYVDHQVIDNSAQGRLERFAKLLEQ